MKKENLKIIILILACIFAGFIAGSFTSSSEETAHTESHEGHDHEEEVWTCSMHPQIKLPKPGKCPICAMDLIPLDKDASANGSMDGRPEITMSEYARKLARVQTVEVTRNNTNSSKSFSGTLNWNEALLKTETAWFGGRIDKLYVTYTGQPVKKGQVIAELYSPELYSAAAELKQAKSNGNAALLESVIKKLTLLGLTKEEIASLDTLSSAHYKQRAKFSGVVVHRNVEEGQYLKTGMPILKLGSSYSLWAVIAVFSEDLSAIRRGQKVQLTAEAMPHKKFTAKVEFIHPTMDTKTRTTKVRLNVKNVNGLLKPGMLIQAQLHSQVKNSPLLIPETAPLLTGRNAVVYVESKPGHYTSRVVHLGKLYDGYYEVLQGLKEGEYVVSRGAFKIDAAMQIQAHPSMMYPAGDGAAGAHDHSSHGSDNTTHKKSTVSHPKKSIKLSKLYPEYIVLQKALASDKEEEALASLKRYEALVHKEMKAKNITEVRDHFLRISRDLIKRMTTENFKPKLGAAVYFCPMANNDRGAEWLQTDGGVLNPYYGSMMLTCGEQKKVLHAPEHGGGK